MQVFTHLIQAFLESLGLSRQQEFVGMMLLLVGLFLTYTGRRFVNDRALSVLMLIGTLALLLTLSTAAPGTRLFAAIVTAATVASAFAWYGWSRRRRPEKSEEQARR